MGKTKNLYTKLTHARNIIELKTEERKKFQHCVNSLSVDIDNLNQEIENIESELMSLRFNESIHLTDHAVVRYFQRSGNASLMSEIRMALIEEIESNRIGSESKVDFKMGKDKYQAIVENNTIITIYQIG